MARDGRYCCDCGNSVLRDEASLLAEPFTCREDPATETNHEPTDWCGQFVATVNAPPKHVAGTACQRVQVWKATVGVYGYIISTVEGLASALNGYGSPAVPVYKPNPHTQVDYTAAAACLCGVDIPATFEAAGIALLKDRGQRGEYQTTDLALWTVLDGLH